MPESPVASLPEHFSTLEDPRADLLDQARAARLAFIGIGSLGLQPTPSCEGEVVSTAELSDLVKRGVVGEINLRYFNDKGEPISSSLDDRVIGLMLEVLKQIDCTVCIAGSAAKFQAIRSAFLWLPTSRWDRASLR